MAINEFRGPYRWLSNFQEVEIELEGIKFPTTEHAYQAAKTLDSEERKRIAALPKPSDAKRAGKKIKLRQDWHDNMKLKIMLELTRKKFKRQDLKEKLLATGDEKLIEGNTWGDTFWGVCNGEGENNLGKIIMMVREELRND